MAPRGATRNGPWCAKEGRTPRWRLPPPQAVPRTAPLRDIRPLHTSLSMAASFRTLPLVYAMMESQRCTEARHDVGRERMDFVTVVDQVLALLRRLSRPRRAGARSAS